MPYPRENILPLTSAPAGANEEAKVETTKPEAAMRHRITRVIASYSGTPAAGSTLTISDGTTTLTTYIAAAGPTQIEPEFQAAAGAKVTIILAAATGVKGALFAFYTID